MVLSSRSCDFMGELCLVSSALKYEAATKRDQEEEEEEKEEETQIQATK